MLSKPNSALIIVGHGSTLNPDSSAPTFDHAESIIQRGIFGEVSALDLIRRQFDAAWRRDGRVGWR